MPARRSYSMQALRAGVRKPPRKEPRGPLCGRWLWGFDRAATRVEDALAGIVADGSTMAMSGLGLRRQSRGRCWPDRRYERSLGRWRGDSGALPEAKFAGEQKLRG
jgi:hypothetical protein